MNKDEKSTLDKLEQSAKILSLVLVPLIVAILGFVIQSLVSEREADHNKQKTTLEYVKLAKEILVDDSEDVSPKLTKWAWQLLNEQAPTNIDPEDLKELIRDREPLPEGVVLPSNIGVSENLASNALLSRVLGEPCKVRRAKIDTPFPLKLAWDTKTILKSISVHEDAVPYFEKAFRLIAERGLQKHAEMYGGTYNCRKKRGSGSWSNHAWAIAIDIDPGNNRLRWGPDRWKMNTGVVKAFEESGFYWHGRSGFNAMAFDLSKKTILEIAKKKGIDLTQ